VLRRLARLPFLAVRGVRWARGRWSKDSDRTYHEQLYEAQAYDPFDAGYPGFLTIRRFADHAAPLIPDSGTVLDLGCGPGEITCELARRHPHVSFLGVDHSAHAIRRAREHATRLGLANVRFEAGDAESLPAADRYALITMFDAFHHLEQPAAFLDWLRGRTSRCLLVEPAGTWSGRWARGLDVDWLLADLANVRDRLEAACGEPPAGDPAAPAPSTPASTGPARGEGAVERRYALDDFAGFFAGWTLHVTGTIAGLDRYPPGAHARSALRGITGELAYSLVRATEELLVARGRDGAAKHWVIAATSEPGLLAPRLPDPRVAPVDAGPSRVASAYDVRYQAYDGPVEAAAGAEFRARLDLRNAGWDTWTSEGPHPVHASYHWLTTRGEMVEFDGLRSRLPAAIGPGDAASIQLAVRAPATPGRYLLAIDLAREGVTWFSEAGVPWHTVAIRVR
jgi:SAM-dependent methyltransferase